MESLVGTVKRKTADKMLPIILFDDICGLCNSSVGFVIKHDKKRLFAFSPLKSRRSKKLLYGQKLLIEDPSTLVLITDLGILVKSDAVIEILLLLGGRWRFVVLLKIIPRKFRDRIYDWIAANRYLWSGNISKYLSMNEKFSDRILI